MQFSLRFAVFCFLGLSFLLGICCEGKGRLIKLNSLEPLLRGCGSVDTVALCVYWGGGGGLIFNLQAKEKMKRIKKAEI